MSNYLSNLAARSLNLTETLSPRSLSLFEPLNVGSMPTSREDVGRERLNDVSRQDQIESLETNTQFNYPKLASPLTKSSELESPLPNQGDLDSSLTHFQKKVNLETPLHKEQELETIPKKSEELEPPLVKGQEKNASKPTSFDLLQPLSNQQESNLSPTTPKPAIPIISDPNVEKREFTLLPSPVQLPAIPRQLISSQPLIEEERQQIEASVNSDNKATPLNTVTETQNLAQNQLNIQEIFQQVKSTSTLLNSESSPRETPPQPYSLQPTLTTLVSSEKSENWQNKNTLESQHQSSTLKSINQLRVNEQIILPAESSKSTIGEIEEADYLAKTGKSSSSQLLILGRSLSNQNDNQKLITNSRFHANSAVQPTNDNRLNERSAVQPIPTIQVNIGRIEVRATPPTVTANQKQSSKTSVMGLDEYLGQRSKGGNR